MKTERVPMPRAQQWRRYISVWFSEERDYLPDQFQIKIVYYLSIFSKLTSVLCLNAFFQYQMCTTVSCQFFCNFNNPFRNPSAGPLQQAFYQQALFQSETKYRQKPHVLRNEFFCSLVVFYLSVNTKRKAFFLLYKVLTNITPNIKYLFEYSTVFTFYKILFLISTAHS